MKKLIFLSILFFSCKTIKITTTPIGERSVPDMTLHQASLAIRELQASAVYTGAIFKVDSKGNASFKDTVYLGVVVIDRLYVGKPDTSRNNNGTDTLIHAPEIFRDSAMLQRSKNIN